MKHLREGTTSNWETRNGKGASIIAIFLSSHISDQDSFNSRVSRTGSGLSTFKILAKGARKS